MSYLTTTFGGDVNITGKTSNYISTSARDSHVTLIKKIVAKSSSTTPDFTLTSSGSGFHTAIVEIRASGNSVTAGGGGYAIKKFFFAASAGGGGILEISGDKNALGPVITATVSGGVIQIALVSYDSIDPFNGTMFADFYLSNGDPIDTASWVAAVS